MASTGWRKDSPRCLRKVQGRTDFLQRVSAVYGTDQPELERMEQERLVLEAKAYQRLALALHAESGTAPKGEKMHGGIPEAIRSKLVAHWREFKQTLGSFLTEFEVGYVVDVRWFEEKARRLEGWGQPRHESKWRPIRKRLLALNRFAEREPLLYDRLRLQVVALLKRTTDDIDRDLGLLPAAATAGLEENEAPGVEPWPTIRTVEEEVLEYDAVLGRSP